VETERFCFYFSTAVKYENTTKKNLSSLIKKIKVRFLTQKLTWFLSFAFCGQGAGGQQGMSADNCLND
jgi:hypothetical protein